MPESTPDPNLKFADPLKVHPEDLPDIQGNILHGYNMPKVRHFVITIGQVSAALSFLDALTSGSGLMSVTSAARWPPGMKPEYALHVGLTAKGLEALKLPATVNFDPGNFGSFLRGAASATVATARAAVVNSLRCCRKQRMLDVPPIELLLSESQQRQRLPRRHRLAVLPLTHELAPPITGNP